MRGDRFANVLIPVNGSQAAHYALRCGLAICHAMGAAATALAVQTPRPDELPPGLPSSRTREFLLRALDQAHREAESWNVAVTTFLAQGHPEHVVPRYARDRDHDLIVVACHDGPALPSTLGDVALRIAAEAHCPVMVAPRRAVGHGLPARVP